MNRMNRRHPTHPLLPILEASKEKVLDGKQPKKKGYVKPKGWRAQGRKIIK